MTDTKRMPKPMTTKELAQYRELKARLIVQAELVLRIFDPDDMYDSVTEVEFEMGHPDEPWVNIWHRDSYRDDCDEYFSCPERYLGMTEDELKAEKTRLEEEERRKRTERAAKAKATREKHKAEKAKKEAEKKASEKDERYKKYLELKAEFEGVTESPEKKPAKEAVYSCRYWEHDDNDPSGCGESWQWCHSEKSGRRECGCKRTYAMQFCPFYKKGELAGRWVISDADKEAAEEFKKEFEGKTHSK